MNALIMGRRGTGKSTLAMHIADHIEAPVIVFDVRGEFRAWPETTVGNVDDLANLILEVHPDTIIYRPAGDADIHQEFLYFVAVLRENDPGEYTLIIDEAPVLQKPQSLHASLSWLVNRAPREINIIQTFQRPTHAHGDCQAQATDWYIFRMTHGADLETVAYRCGPQVAEAVSKLKTQQYVHWSDLKESYETVRDPRAWFANLRGKDAKRIGELPSLRVGVA